MEQRSIELSLEFRYMFVTDITNCYGSVNPQAFDWAFSLKDTRFENGNKIQSPKTFKNIFVHSNKDATLASHREVPYLTLSVKSFLDILTFCYMKQFIKLASLIHTK